MPPIPKRVGLVSYEGPDPTIEISPEQFERLGGIYGVALTLEDQGEIIARANTYLFGRRCELTSASYSEVRRLFEDVKEAVRPFWRFTGGRTLDHSDASTELRGILHSQYRKSPVRVHPSHLLVVQRDGSRKPAQLPGNIELELNDTTLAAFAGSLVYALQKAEQVIRQYEQDDQKKGFAPGKTFRDWLASMKLWAKERGYPYGPYRSDNKSGAFDDPAQKASAFSEFLFELNKMFRAMPIELKPKDGKSIISWGEPVKNVQALAERLKEVVARANALRATDGG